MPSAFSSGRSNKSCRYNSLEKQEKQLPKTHSNDAASTALAKSKTHNSLRGMVKKYLMDKKPSSDNKLMLPRPVDTTKKNSAFKLLVSGGGADARTLAMVLKSERELLSQHKHQAADIIQLRSILNDKNTEVDKLKDLCLKQREQIKELKSAILFPDTTQLQGLLHKHDSELKQAKHIIPTLQRQVTSLTDQLQCLAQDLAEVKADKYSVMGCYDGLVSSPTTPAYEQDEATNSLDLSSGDRTTPGSPDDLFLNDLNPCLTPCAKSKSKDFEVTEYGSCMENSSYSNTTTTRYHEIGFGSHGRKLSKSSNDAKSARSGMIFSRRSDENKYTYGKHMHY